MESIKKATEKYRDLISEAERFVWNHAETGYKEVQTSQFLADKFRALGYDLILADDVPGFYTVVDTGREGPEVLVLGELDSVICRSHPQANAETGAVHACGHNVHCAALLGVAAALREPALLSQLCGKIRLCAVPAEELLEIDYRSELIKKGTIRFMGGKAEFLHRGYFDGVDMAFMVHTGRQYGASAVHNGFVTKKITFKGRAAHAGGDPENGKNALYAANCAINAINALRETFRDGDHVRVHPIITHGGDMVNAIPERVTVESYIRASSIEAISDAEKKVDRAVVGAALSMGVNVDVETLPGYSPVITDKGMLALCKEAADLIIPEENFVVDDITTASTDMGDLSMIMPACHPHTSGAIGQSHGADYYIADTEKACIKNVCLQLMMLKLLLENKAERANKIIKEHTPVFPSKEAFLEYLSAFYHSGDRIEYSSDNTAVARITRE